MGWAMDVNLPQFNSCCFCIPLRTGILTLGYLNSVYHGLLFILAAFVAYVATLLTVTFAGEFPPLEVSLLVPLVTASVVAFYVFVIVATYKEDERLFKVTLILGTALLIFTVPYSICVVYRMAKAVDLPGFNDNDSRNQFKLGVYITAVILEPITMAYTLLLVRSLKFKLREKNDGEYIDLGTNIELGGDYERMQ